MFYQIFLSPQVKQCAIITYKHDMYEFTSRVAKQSKTYQEKISGKCLKPIE